MNTYTAIIILISTCIFGEVVSSIIDDLDRGETRRFTALIVEHRRHEDAMIRQFLKSQEKVCV